MFERSHLQSLIKRAKEPRKYIQVLMGPRQVGKTTLIGQLLQKYKGGHHFVSADAVLPSNNSWLDQQWDIVRLKMEQEQAPEYILVIDEIQKIDKWSEIVKLNWDSDSRNKLNIKVILLGSSRLLLQNGLTESLAGRYESTYLGHWEYKEMKEAFGWTINQYVWFGGYPGSASLIDDEDRWKAYVQQSLIEPSISKDILMMTRVDKPALMKQLFELGCAYSGQILSYNKMLGQLHDAGNTTTLTHYLQLLNTAGLLGGLEKYAADIIRKRSSSPKLQVHNTALISAQHGDDFKSIVMKPAEWGRMVESSIGAHLVNNAISGGYAVRYWRQQDEEVDFVIERKKKIIALEVKSGNASATSGMDTFRKQFKPERVLLIGNTGLRWQELLEIDPATLF